MRKIQYIVFVILLVLRLGFLLFPVTSILFMLFMIGYLFGNAYLSGGLKNTESKVVFWIGLAIVLSLNISRY